MPMAGPALAPIVAACTSRVPIIGPVQENETSASVKAIKNILNSPVAVSAFLSNLLVQEDGRVNSKAPKKEIANNNSNPKNNMLNIALVERLFNAFSPE